MVIKGKRVCGWERPKHLKPYVRIHQWAWLSQKASNEFRCCPEVVSTLAQEACKPRLNSEQSAIREVGIMKQLLEKVSSIPYPPTWPFRHRSALYQRLPNFQDEDSNVCIGLILPATMDRHSELEPILQIGRLRPSRVTSWPTQLANHSLMLCFPSPSSVYSRFVMCCFPEGQPNFRLMAKASSLGFTVPSQAGITPASEYLQDKDSPQRGSGQRPLCPAERIQQLSGENAARVRVRGN